MPFIPDSPAPDTSPLDASSADAPATDAPAPSSKSTQKLTSRRVASTRTTQTWWTRLAQPMTLPHVTQLGLSSAGGALAVVMVSLSINWFVGREPLRDFFGRTPGESGVSTPERVALPSVAPVQSAIEVGDEDRPIQFLRSEPVFVEGANEDGTALAELKPLTDDDRLRIEKRREGERLLRERRVLEDRKRAIERQLEDKQIEERRRDEDSRMVDGRRDEDKKRIEEWLNEDRRILDERNEKERQAIADAQRHDETQQLAEAQP